MTTTINITQLAEQLFDYATTRNWSVSRLCREFPGLGSDRTFRDVRAGKLKGYNVDDWTRAYAAAITTIRDQRDTKDAPLYDDLNTVFQVHRAVLGAMNNTGTNRVVIVEGDSGAGKTTAIQIIMKKYGDRIIQVEASTVWNDRPKALIDAILKSLGVSEPPSQPVAAFDAVTHHLSTSRRCLVIDEAHHLGPRCLDTIKSLVNRTRGEFVLLAMQTLWTRLGTRAYNESKQLVTNRLAERVCLTPTLLDISTYLLHSVPSLTSDNADKAAISILPASIHAGNFAFVRDVADLLADANSITPKTVTDAVADIKARR